MKRKMAWCLAAGWRRQRENWAPCETAAPPWETEGAKAAVSG